MIYNIKVPNEGPLDARVFVVGESPGDDEEIQRRPFVGQSGQLLRECLRRNGISETNVRFCNLSNYRPQGNLFEKLIGSSELNDSFRTLQNEIKTARPNLIIPLGSVPLKYLTGKDSITKFRGSILPYKEDKTIKCISTFHPSAVTRNGEYYPMFDMDLSRCGVDQLTPDFNYPKRNYIIAPEGFELLKWTEILCNSDRLAVDIESVIESTHILCVGFAPSPGVGVCIPYTTSANLTAINQILESQAKKIFHYGTFDIEMLRLNGHVCNNYWWDTIIGQHVLNPEMPRGLDFLGSIYTREPYYKTEGRGEIPGDQKAWSDKADKNKLYIYNCKDVCVTAEIQLEQEKELRDRDLEIFQYEMSLQEPAFAIMNAGLYRDEAQRKMIEKACLIRWAKLQTILNGLAGKKVNVNSPKQITGLLYDELKFPAKRKRGGNITADEDAIVSLIALAKGKLVELKTDRAKPEWERKLAILRCILSIRGTRKTLSSYILPRCSTDGCLRSSVSVAATETARWSMSKYVDGTGINAQTLPREGVEVPDSWIEHPETIPEELLEISLLNELGEEDENPSP